MKIIMQMSCSCTALLHRTDADALNKLLLFYMEDKCHIEYFRDPEALVFTIQYNSLQLLSSTEILFFICFISICSASYYLPYILHTITQLPPHYNAYSHSRW